MAAKKNQRKRRATDTKKGKRKPGGGRHRKDLGAMTRAIVWYYAVRAIFIADLMNDADHQIPLHLVSPDEVSERLNAALDKQLNQGIHTESTGTPDDRLDMALDQEFHVSERRFQAIRNDARDPGFVNKKRKLHRLVDSVGSHPGFEHTVAIYDSKLWRLITRSRPKESEIAEIIAELLRKKGLYRATDAEAAVGIECSVDKYAFKPASREAFKAGIDMIKSEGTADSLGLLGALFRESIAHHSVANATVIDDAFTWCLIDFESRNSMDKDASILLHQLCQCRIFQDRWDTVPDRQSLAMARAEINRQRREKNSRLLSTKKDSWRVQALALRFNNRSAAHRYPIVPLSD